MDHTTIVAIATPMGSGGISVVRLSGTKSGEIASRLFSTLEGLTVDKLDMRKLYLGTFQTPEFCEQCLCVRFVAPHSFTGEDVVEFQIHGGRTLAQSVLAACLKEGARLAEPGEFTKRAYLNGKMTLSAVEGTVDMIEAGSTAELNAAYSLVSRTLSDFIDKIRSALLDVISGVEVALDYPEEDLEVDTLSRTRQRIEKEVLPPVVKLIATRPTAAAVKNGITAAIVGKPNVGKSSLLNALLGTARAIVTDIAGTTRDSIAESVEYKNVRFNFVDTAGLREGTVDTVELLGMETTRRVLDEADIVLFVTDNTYNGEDDTILKMLPSEKPRLNVRNKSDLAPKKIKGQDADIELSCTQNKNIEDLKASIYIKKVDNNILEGGVMLSNARHYSCLIAARQKLLDALAAPTLDVVTVDLREVAAELGKIDGATVSQEVTDSIFSKFCLGK